MLSEEDLLETINVLNTHASIRVSMYQRCSKRFYCLFNKFIQAFENSGNAGFEEKYLKKQNSLLYNAY